jgi:hypothetical protein
MTSGVLMFAHNNREIDYGMMAYVSARYVEKNLKVPVSLITDSGTIKWLDKKDTSLKNVFDKIILTDELSQPERQDKRFYDGSVDYKKTAFNNGFRARAYDLTPYDKTLVIDTDVLIKNDQLKNIWNSNTDFMINHKHIDVEYSRNRNEFNKISEYTVDFYWATIFYFEKTEWTKTFFDLCQHIAENYEYYRFIYQIAYPLLRNDYIFSIAVHIMNGFNNKTKPQTLPADLYYTLDRDVLHQVNLNGDLVFLIQKENLLGEYTLAKTGNQNIHIMNKYSFSRNIPNLLEALNVN